MRYRYSSLAMAFTIVFTLVGIDFSAAGEQLGFPPPDPPGTIRPELNEANVARDVDTQLRQRFEIAAGHSNHLLTASQANAAGWGFIADHFAEIDRDRDGYVNFSDISDFMSARSPVAKNNTKGKGGVQIVE